MSTLDLGEKLKLEEILKMSGGDVLHFTHRTFQAFVYKHSGVDIEADEYATKSNSKANRLRSFWELHNDQTVGQVVQELVAEASRSGGGGDQLVIGHHVRVARAVAGRLAGLLVFARSGG